MTRTRPRGADVDVVGPARVIPYEPGVAAQEPLLLLLGRDAGGGHIPLSQPEPPRPHPLLIPGGPCLMTLHPLGDPPSLLSAQILSGEHLITAILKASLDGCAA